AYSSPEAVQTTGTVAVAELDTIEQGREPLAEELKRARIISQYGIIHAIAPGGQADPPPDDLDAQRLGNQAVVLRNGRPGSPHRNAVQHHRRHDQRDG